MQPVFDTVRLQLRPAADEDLNELWRLWTEPEVRQFLWDDILIDREQARETIRDSTELAPQGLGLWTIVQRETTGGLVGCAGLMPVGSAAQYFPPIAGAVEPLVALAPKFWHRGYARESADVLIQYATESLRLDRLVAVADAPNVASHRLLEGLGFVLCAETDGPRHRLRHYNLKRTSFFP